MSLWSFVPLHLLSPPSVNKRHHVYVALEDSRDFLFDMLRNFLHHLGEPESLTCFVPISMFWSQVLMSLHPGTVGSRLSHCSPRLEEEEKVLEIRSMEGHFWSWKFSLPVELMGNKSQKE